MGSRLGAETSPTDGFPPSRPDPSSVEFFEAKVRPALVEHCYPCHSADAKTPKAGLRLDTRAGLRSGGDSGPAVVPGKPGESLLVKAVRRAAGGRYSNEMGSGSQRGGFPGHRRVEGFAV